MRILLDLDCVLADFVHGAAVAHGLIVEQVTPHWKQGTYTMDQAISKALGRNGDYKPEDFWAPLNGSREFWAELPDLPWARDLVELVQSKTDDWAIVTSPSRCDTCVPGKRDWCNRFFGVMHFENLIPWHKKYMFANPRTILIDDYDKNVDEFNKAGGHGILLPAHHNSRHEFKADPFTVVQRTLERKVQLCI